MKIQSFDTKQDFIKACSDFVADVCSMESDVIRIVLSGGNTPGPVYAALSERDDIPWAKLELYQVDERYVPHSHEDSNFKMIHEKLSGVRIVETRGLHAFDTELTIDECIDQYAELLNKNLDHGFDLCILGVGPDGHVASLFPGSPALNEATKLVAHTQTDAFAVHDRLTLTFPALMQSKKLLLLLKGQEKQAVIDELQSGTKNFDEFPVKKLLEHADLSVLFCSK